jgi:hypothetical protein
MTESFLSQTTHTLVLAQVEQLNDRLADHRHPPSVVADELGLTGATEQSGEDPEGLPPGAVLTRLCCIGTPEWPYIHGHFRVPDATDDSSGVEFHSAALRELSRRTGFRHVWGD